MPGGILLGASAHMGRPGIGRATRHGPPLTATDLPQAAGSNFLSDIVSGIVSTDVVEDQVKPKSQAAGDDFLLDLGGASKMHRTLDIIGHALFNEGKATAPTAGCSRSL
jgi:hypothetical protein